MTHIDRRVKGNLPYEISSNEDMFNIFRKYGHLAHAKAERGFGFLQFFTEDAARKAMDGLKGCELHGQKFSGSLLKFDPSKHANDVDIEFARERNSVETKVIRSCRDDHRSDARPRTTSCDLPQSTTLTNPVLYSQLVLLYDNESQHSITILQTALQGKHLPCEVIAKAESHHPKDAIHNLVARGAREIVEIYKTNHDDIGIYLHLYELTDGTYEARFREYQGLSIDDAARLIWQSRCKAACDLLKHSMNSSSQATRTNLHHVV